MSRLVRLQDIEATEREVLGTDYYNPAGKTAYGIGEEKIGKVEDALVEVETGRVRYLIVDVGGWFSSKEVLIPAGLSRIVGDDVYFDSLTKDQAEAMEAYDRDYVYNYQEQYAKDRDFFAAETLPAESRVELTDNHYTAPNTLELLEERLSVNKDRIASGVASIGKRVVSEEQRVEVELQEEHAHIERTAVNRPTDRRIGDDAGVATVSVELEAERANVSKDTFVTEEVTLGKTTGTRTETILETIQREELNVDDLGNVVDREGNVVSYEGITADEVRRARGL
ncbi:Uncharacterized protein conserved in bacteria [Moraxella lacunata]|uniref:Photosystem reaction center subunit H n=1 Tax=Moraxella lacunata TaxID=477 RepID=A0A1V4H390_MORLA|nr:PRC and DUF2382 domain-containing protein [Moraxella lacunata]OPH38856.1 photosystem reaction center subunit H [Moraxella lacunata]STZ01243.1 Uncharacterized protein conserved in bacteria [Moraxella lacunata]